ncbi:MAG TPA: hypothetical protein VF796_14295, partial [Humisphaera sp.]
MSGDRAEFDHVVIGSGAGGGPLAAELVRAGRTVLLLEAGGEHEGANYSVPAFHPLSTEEPECRWDYFVKHYSDVARQRQDAKYVPEGAGIWYPRAGTLGGCTAHHALITLCPHNRDWDRIAQATGDASWSAANMRGHFERLERCGYLPPGSGGRHGFDGWLPTAVGDPALAQADPLLAGFLQAVQREVGRPVHPTLDPNHWDAVPSGAEGLCAIPMSVGGSRRAGARERVRAVQREFPDRLVVRTNALATGLLWEGTTCVGV